MKLVAISDTHGDHKYLEIPECDILIHAGDFSFRGEFFEVRNFMLWFEKQPARYKVCIAGNHELTFDSTQSQYQDAIRNLLAKHKEIIYLENEAITIEGIKFYGTPWTPYFCNWAFNGLRDQDVALKRGQSLTEIYSHIPEDTNIILCHAPPYNLVDRNQEGQCCGSMEMRKVVDKMPLLYLYICGHVHEARGVEELGGVTFANVSSLGRDYKTIQPLAIFDLNIRGMVQSVEGFEKENEN